MNASDDNEFAPKQAEWPFDEIAKSDKAFRRAEKQRFQDFIFEHDHPLAAALAEEATRFDIVQRGVIEPVMREVADKAAMRGYHVFVTRDDAMDRLVLLASPSIRFYCSRQPFDTPVYDLICSPPFVAFYGYQPTKSVEYHLHNSNADSDHPSEDNNFSLEYTEITQDRIRSILIDFVDTQSSAGKEI